MHNQPHQPLNELETLRKENQRIKQQLKEYQESEFRLYEDLSCLFKFIGTENTTGNPVFVGNPASIKTIIDLAKNNLDTSSRLDKRYSTPKEDTLFLEPDLTLE